MDVLKSWTKVKYEYENFQINLERYFKRYYENETFKKRKPRSQITFFWNLLETSLGLTQIWRFPSLAYKTGGGAFILCYALLMFTIGNSTLFLEISLGQVSSDTGIQLFKKIPIGIGIGFSSITYSLFFVSNFTHIVAYALHYLYLSFNNPLPWTECPLNTTCQNLPPSFYFWEKINLFPDNSENLGIFNSNLVLASLIIWIVIFSSLNSKTSVVNKLKRFFLPLPFILMILFIFVSMPYDGVEIGLAHLFLPKFEDFLNIEIWAFALEQTLLSLGIGMTFLINKGSKTDKKHLTYIDCYIVTFIIFSVSIFWSIVVFINIGIMTKNFNLIFDKFNFLEPSLLFIIYPYCLNRLPGTTFFSIVFFTMIINTGLTSIVGLSRCLIEVYKNFIPKLKINYFIFTILYSLMCFFISFPNMTQNGYYYFEILDRFGGGQSLIFICSYEIILISYSYGLQRFSNDIYNVVGYKPNFYYKILWALNGFVIFGIGLSYCIISSLKTGVFYWSFLIILFNLAPILCGFFVGIFINLRNGKRGFDVFRPNSRFLRNKI